MTRCPYEANFQYRRSASRCERKYFRSWGGRSITIPAAARSLRLNFRSGVVVWVPSESVLKSTLSPRTRSVSGAPVKNVVRWSFPAGRERSGGRPQVTKGRLSISPTRCGNECQRVRRRAARSRPAGVRAADEASERFATSPRTGAAQTDGAKLWKRAWLPTARIAAERSRVRGIRTFLEVVARREAIHPSQELRLRHRRVVDADAAEVEPESIGQILHGAAGVVDVARPEREETVELEFGAAVLDPGAVREKRLVHVGHHHHPVCL